MEPGIEFQEARIAAAGRARIMMMAVKLVLRVLRGRKRILKIA